MLSLETQKRVIQSSLLPRKEKLRGRRVEELSYCPIGKAGDHPT